MIGTREVVHQVHPQLAESMRAGMLSSLSGLRAGLPAVNHRREDRVSEQRVCTYEICESIDEEAVVIQEGEAYSLNQSTHGILLLMGYAPRVQQLLELHIPESRWCRSMNLYEIQWTKSISIESRGELFLVGCRLTFGPSRYWAF